jgi:hypothetical protein
MHTSPLHAPPWSPAVRAIQSPLNALLQQSDCVIAPHVPLFHFLPSGRGGVGVWGGRDAEQHNHSSVMASKSRARRGSLSSPISATSPKGTSPQVRPTGDSSLYRTSWEDSSTLPRCGS